MAVDRLLFSDDFSSYASDAAFKAAYPYDPPTNTTTSVTRAEWSATGGPGGGPGVFCTDMTGGAGIFDKCWLSPQCYEFRLKGRWDFTEFVPVNIPDITHSIISMWWAPAGDRLSDFAGNIVQLVRLDDTNTLRVTLKTTAAFANGAANIYFEDFAGLLTGDHVIQVDGRRSTMTESSPGVWAPNEDGFVRVSVGGSQVFSFDGPVWHDRSDINATPYWNAISVYVPGRVTDIEVWDETSCDPATFGDRSAIDCCVVAPNMPTGQGASPLLQPSIPTFLDCGGGGLVPILAPVTESEAWWGLG